MVNHLKEVYATVDKVLPNILMPAFPAGNVLQKKNITAFN